MDNKKLMHILLKDVIDLEDFILGLKKAGTSDPLDFELMHTKISGVRHMLEVMGKRDIIHVQPEPARAVEKQEVMDFTSDNGRPVIETTPEVPTEKKEWSKADNEQMPEGPESVVLIPESEPVVADVPPITASTPDEDGRGDEVELEEEAATEKHTLGERFVQGRSVNDLLLGQAKSESKYSNMPVTNLQSAIGINDRFLFTRELFEGNTRAFNEVILKLDSMSGIHEAAVYLRENFKWKKTETSLKFIDLVKRRFM